MFAAELAVLVSLAACFRLAGLYWGASGFAAYALVRRVLGFTLPVVTLGVDVGMPRFIALCGSEVAVTAGEYLVAATVICGSSLVATSLLVALWREPLAFVLFGSATRVSWLLPLVWLLVGFSLYVVVFSYWRGRMRVHRAALLYVLSFGIAPICAVLSVRSDALGALTVLGISAAMLALAFLPFGDLVLPSFQRLRGKVLALLKYGGPRMIGSVALLVLFALPALIAAQTVSLELAGLLAFAVTVVGSLGSLVNPIGTVLLPTAARYSGEGRLSSLKRPYSYCVIFIALIGLLATALLIVGSNLLLSFFVPRELLAYVSAFRWSAIGIVPYMYFCLARHVIDAHTTLAHNTLNTILAVISFVAVEEAIRLVFDSNDGTAQGVALTIALCVLALRSHMLVRRFLSASISLERIGT